MINLDAAVLSEQPRLAGRSLGDLASELLAAALRAEPLPPDRPLPFHWTAKQMGARVDLEDKDAVRRLGRSSDT